MVKLTLFGIPRITDEIILLELLALQAQQQKQELLEEVFERLLI